MLSNQNLTVTENSDKAYSTTGSKCLDFFTRITRSATVPDYVPAFFETIREDFDAGFKLLFNLRDIRGGKGEKLIPIVLMVCLKNMLPTDSYKLLLEKYVTYGCWKDVLKIAEINARLQLELNPAMKTTDIDNNIEFNLFAKQLKIDYDLLLNAELNSDKKKVAITLCAKWAPSEKTHFNLAPIHAADRIRKIMHLKPKAYRLMLSKMRAHLEILERLMSTNQVELIDFEKIPSIAMSKMKKSFARDTNSAGLKSEVRVKLHQSYEQYLSKLTTGKAKVNIKGLQPHELITTYLRKGVVEIDPLVEAQWSTLVEKTKEAGTFKNTIAIVDTSGSMDGQPLQVSIAMGILVAECSNSEEKKVITFNETPRWHNLEGSNLREKVNCMDYKDWGGSTNLRKVFELILADAVKVELPVDQMVSTLIIFTDMQFDSVGSRDDKWQSTFEYATELFTIHGYNLPKIVCWNLRTSSTKSLPATKDEENYVMLSGFSSELLKHVITGESFTPISMMNHVLEPYENPIQKDSVDIVPVPFELDKLEKAIANSMLKKAFIKVNVVKK